MHGGGEASPNVELTLDVFPEVQRPLSAKNLQTGVSTESVLSSTSTKAEEENLKKDFHWYVLRVTYGREKKACEYLRAKGINVFYPTLTTYKLVNGKRKHVEGSRLPNILFAYDTYAHLKIYVFNDVNLSYLRFYYSHICLGNKLLRQPLIVPDDQMETLRIICDQEKEDIIMVQGEVPKFKTGQIVQIVDGKFKGITGRVARYQGQQRVAVIIEGFMTMMTAYVPNAFIERKIDNK